MSQSADGATISAIPRPQRRGRSGKLARVWELVSEIVRVLVSREPDLVESRTPVVSAASLPSDTPPKWIPRKERKRSLFRRSEPADAAMPAVWQNVQSRALLSGLTGASSRAGLDRASVGSPGELDWRPFLIARINDDFARPQVMPD